MNSKDPSLKRCRLTFTKLALQLQTTLKLSRKSELTKSLTAAIYWRSGVGARIALASGKLHRSYSLLYLYGTVSHLYGMVVSYLYGMVRCSLIFNHGKTSPAHGKRQHACLEVHIQQIINLGKKCCIAAHLDEWSSQIAFCTFVDRGNLQLFVWCAHENSISATQDQNDQRLLYLTFVLQIDHV